jgi:LCP family protein required for cell wall assembly
MPYPLFFIPALVTATRNNAMLRSPFTRHVARVALPVSLAAALLLVGCTRDREAEVERAAGGGQVYLPVVVDGGDTASAAAAQAIPSEPEVVFQPPPDVSLLPAPPLTESNGAPLPPVAPPATGMLIAAKNPSAVFQPIGEATDVTASAGQDVVAVELPAPTPTIPPLTQAQGGEPFDWQASENYLVLGTDRRADGGSWRTDSIMMVGLDRTNKRAAVFSIPRDLYVSIPGYGYGRINQADYMGERRSPDGGGPALVGGIVEDMLGIRTDHWVRIQMDGFVEFVDALGGVSVYLDCPFSEPIFNLTSQRWEAFRLPAGENLLDGQDAYWFARLRYNESDIGRSRRQRALIWAMRDQILSTNALARLPQLYSAFQDTISTDLSLFKIVSLAQFATGLDAANVRAGGLTLRDLQNYTTPGGAQVLIIGNPTRVRNLVAGVWDQPAMADAYRAEAAGCDPLPTVEVTAGAETVQQSLPATAPDAGGQLPFVQIIAPGMDNAAVQTVTQLPGQELLAPAGSESRPVVLPPLFDPVADRDPATGIVYDPITGFPFDPTTGLYVDPVTGLPVDVESLPPVGG